MPFKKKFIPLDFGQAINVSFIVSDCTKSFLFLDRIARQVLDNPKENRSSMWNNGAARETGKDEHAALVILVSLCLFPSSRNIVLILSIVVGFIHWYNVFA